MEHSHSHEKSWILIIFLIYFVLFPQGLSHLRQKKKKSNGALFVQNNGMYNSIISNKNFQKGNYKRTSTFNSG